MILAAGFGTRLRPLTNTIPKPLLPVAGAPLIVWNLLLLRRHAITEIMINLHHLGHLIEQALGDGKQFGVRLTYSHEPVILGTGGGLKQAEPFFQGEPFLVVNGDTMLDLDLSALLAFHREQHALATMVVRRDPDAATWGEIRMSSAGRIVSIAGRGGYDAGTRESRMFAGVHVMHPRLLQTLPKDRESSVIDAYVEAIGRGEPVYGYDMEGYWSDVGTPERYAAVQRDAESGLIKLEERRALST